ncbi:hypothetical protein Csa_001257 [Cucumis sativus]|nr:hypothetical protein Csa_001257 [Cucumis sativus]
MGIKVLSVQNMVSWSCFHLMKNAIPPPPPSSDSTNIKLIHSDGVVRIYHRPIYVSEVLLEFPKHLGNNPKPLPPQQSPSLPLGKICTTPQLAKDYTQLVRTRKWKPKLETIKETQKKRISSFGLKKANPFPSTPIRSPYPLHHLRSIHFAYKHKIRIKARS